MRIFQIGILDLSDSDILEDTDIDKWCFMLSGTYHIFETSQQAEDANNALLKGIIRDHDGNEGVLL